MDEGIQEWKNMWKQKKAKLLGLDEQIKQLNKLEKKENFRRVALIGALIILFICWLIEDPEFDKSNINNIIGFGLAVIGVIMLLIMNYKTKIHIPNNKNLYNYQSINKNLKKIVAFNLKQLFIPLIILVISINFLLLGFYDKGELFSYEFKREYRLPIHLSTIVLPFISYFLNFPRLKRLQKEASETINQLENIIENEI